MLLQLRKESPCSSPFLAATIVGAGAIKLGAMSAMVSVLALAIQALLIANIMGIAYVIWRKYRESDPQ